MNTNNTNNRGGKLVYPELSYLITGICFNVHNRLGRFSREKQYADELEKELINSKVNYQKEFDILDTGNKVDFLINNQIIIELKAKKFILKEDYYQIQRYLQAANIKLGLIINFQNRYLKPIRVIKIETGNKGKYLRRC